MAEKDPSDRPLITIVTPSLNAGDTILQTLSSVYQVSNALRANNFNLEHLIIDGGSTDQTINIARSYQSLHSLLIDVYLSKKGIYPAMNRGLFLAKGYYTHVLNADDFILNPEAYARTIMCAYATSSQVLLGSIHYFQRKSNIWRHIWRITALPDSEHTWRLQLDRGHHYPHPGMIVNTEIYRRIGFDTRYELAADYKMMQLLFRSKDCPKEKIYACADPLVAMATGGTTGTMLSVLRGMRQVKLINQELGIHSPIVFRYLRKVLMRLPSLIFWSNK